MKKIRELVRKQYARAVVATRKRLSTTRVLFTTAAVCLLLLSCGEVDQTSVSSEDVARISSNLYIMPSVLWPLQSMPVPVCWENDNNDPTENAQREWVRNQIDKTWSFVSKFQTGGWGHCAPTSTGIRINIASIAGNGPYATGLGNAVSGATPGLYLDFTFTNWDFTYPDGSKCSDPGMNEVCIRAIAAHEFGHLLGYPHEQLRPDTPSWCDTPPDGGVPGATTYGDWDLTSIMNYCSPQRELGVLTGTDVAGTQYYYGLGPRYVAAIISTLYR
jgi:hypothetical protein